MRPRLLSPIVLCASAALLWASPVGAASHRLLAPRGDLLITFSGSGGGGYRFHDPASGAGSGCRSADTTYVESDSYTWSYTFAVPPAGGRGVAPLSSSGSGLLISTQQTARCGGTPGATTSCTQSLRTPTQANSADLDYPGVDVTVSGRQITVGGLGELLRSPAQSFCTGGDGFVPNLVAGYAGLQASVSFSRAQLARNGSYRGTFTMAGAGLYAGVPLSGGCNATSCDTSNCATDLPGGPGAPNSCSYNESYSGTIEVRVIKG